MNGEKARELFSDYREGTLSPNLRDSLEQAMKSDSVISQDYQEFKLMLENLELNSSHVAEVPFDLHDKIMARVDKNIFEAKANAKPSWFAGWRLGLVGGLACVFIAGTVFSLKGGSARTDTAGIIETPQKAHGLEVVANDGEIRVTHGAAASVVVVKDDATGDLLQKFSLEGKKLDSPLTNDRETSVLVSIQSESESVLVALPGTQRTQNTVGEGSLKDLAKAISDRSGEAVRLESKDANTKVAWKLDTSDFSQSKATLGTFYS